MFKDTVLPVVCFSECTACNNIGISIQDEAYVYAYPNPSKGSSNIQLYGTNNHISITDAFGRSIKQEIVYDKSVYEINNLPAGIYFITVSAGKLTSKIKLIVQ